MKKNKTILLPSAKISEEGTHLQMTEPRGCVEGYKRVLARLNPNAGRIWSAALGQFGYAKPLLAGARIQEK